MQKQCIYKRRNFDILKINLLIIHLLFIKRLKNKCQKALNILKFLCSTDCGADSTV